MRRQKQFLKTIAIAIMSSVIFSLQATAQFDALGDIMKAGQDDAEKMMKAYLTPLGKAWGYDLAGGWYNTASTHKTLGFDLSLSVNFAQTPDADMLFDIANLGLEQITSATSSKEFPTITNGEDVNSIKMEETYTNEDIPGSGTQTIEKTVTLLEPTQIKGFDVPVGIPMPTMNVGVGLIKNTDLVGRFVPNVAIGDFGTIGLWGIGVKHDFLQWLPIVDKIPFLKGSVFLGYTNMGMSANIPYNTPDVDDPAGYENPNNQELETTISAFHGAVLVGAKLPIIHPYISLGLTKSKFDLNLLGEYALPKPEVSGSGANAEIQTTLDAEDKTYTLQDPISLSIPNDLNPSIGVGLRVKLAVVTLYGQYTIQNYPMYTGGLGISFR